ncbi:hypothetical protein PENANT_c007G11076 [Penicillium antarcticum]|uniref:Uncharacterized protein n=1 Tax=Penicillium antarcticum TaxID=416450 RepID=A0A1V6QC14_9EURO|nr:hypothetical protein PENANT_c007G11076 [Penicillium antarcticum]
MVTPLRDIPYSVALEERVSSPQAEELQNQPSKDVPAAVANLPLILIVLSPIYSET